MTDKEIDELVRKSYADVNKDYITEQVKDACLGTAFGSVTGIMAANKRRYKGR